MKRIYISGPMTGMPDKNFPAFNAEAARLRALGYDVVNPVEINGYAAVNEGRSHIDCLRNDVAGLVTCDTVALLPLPPGLYSKGMDIEIQVADLLEIKLVHALTINKPYRVDAKQAGRACDKPPEGWVCSREFGHEGPCAARQSESFLAKLKGYITP